VRGLGQFLRDLQNRAFDEYERLLTAAEATDPRTHLLVLLGADAGLRVGETIALEQTDVGLRLRLLTEFGDIVETGRSRNERLK
jgi:integrase